MAADSKVNLKGQSLRKWRVEPIRNCSPLEQFLERVFEKFWRKRVCLSQLRRRWNYFLIPGQHSRAWQGQVVVSFVRQEVQGTRLRPQAHLQQARRESRRGIDSFFPFRYSPFLILCLKFCYFGPMTYFGGRPARNPENFCQSSCVALWLVNFLLLNAVPVQVYWCTVNVEERWQPSDHDVFLKKN